MRVAIEREQLRVTHTHTNGDVLDSLVYLECAKLKHVVFDRTESPTFLDGFTTLELNHLYRNTTGVDLPATLSDLGRREAIANVIEQLTPVQVSLDELDAQIAAVYDQLEAPLETAVQFKYVYGAKVPAVLDGGLFPISAPPRNAEQLAEAANSALQRRSEPPAATAPASPATPPARKRSEPSAPTGGSRPAIWAHADKVWEEAGKPMNAPEVLALRKRMMVELEELGIKKTTSSTALGDWMKTRLKV